jgi:hypothetical protein
MTQPNPQSPPCPKCGNTEATLCAQSIEYGPEERLGQPLKERELHTLAFQCKCGMAFTKTVCGDKSPPRS